MRWGHGDGTVGYGADGKALNYINEFLDFCWERSAYGSVLVRDLPDAVTAPRTVSSDDKKKPLKASHARKLHEKNLVILRSAKVGKGNELLNVTAHFAGRALAALGKTEDEIKAELLHIVTKEWKNPHPAGGAKATIASGLTSGMAEPLMIVQPPSLPWRNSSEQITVEKSPAIIDRLIYQASSTGLVGKIKLGKTTLALDISEAIICGSPFLKEEVIAGSVLYVSEQPLASFMAELQNSGLLGHGIPGQLSPHANARNGAFHFVTIEDWFKLSWTEIVEASVEHATKIGACMVIFDTLSRIARVEDENNASEMQSAVDELTPLLKNGISTLCIQHERKSGGDIQDAGRGSSALGGSVDCILRLCRP